MNFSGATNKNEKERIKKKKLKRIELIMAFFPPIFVIPAY
jgi:hypothetical protein